MPSTNSEKKTMLQQFTQKALQRLESNKLPKTATLFIPSIEQEIKIRSLSKAEIKECYDVEDDENDMSTTDKYTVYISVIEPNLKEVAKELKEQGKIQTYIDVVDMFELHEIAAIGMEAMKLSGVVAGDKAVKVVKDLKN